MSRFVGKLDFAPQDPGQPKEWKLAKDFGFVRDDGIMVVSPKGAHTDGASIPRFLWSVPWIGHPFRLANRFFSQPHDAGYAGIAVIIDLNAAQITPETALDIWRESAMVSYMIHGENLSRKWWDETMREAMEVPVLKVKRWKKNVVYSAVRIFGRRAYRKHRGKRGKVLPRHSRGSVEARG